MCKLKRVGMFSHKKINQMIEICFFRQEKRKERKLMLLLPTLQQILNRVIVTNILVSIDRLKSVRYSYSNSYISRYITVMQ
uniref:Uncharacterized protein n=1 Tax=Octopus bimaculoides TaxID=37653 RepID=A0A0L8FZ85_OCTBM